MLRARLIRLAHAQKDLRPYVLPLLKRAWSALDVGKTILSNNKMFRIHRYRDSVVITDLTNAGRRGKKCAELTFYSLDFLSPEAEGEIEDVLGDLAEMSSFSEVRASIVDLIFRLKKMGITRPAIDMRELRGVDVVPAQFSPFTLRTDQVYVNSEWTSFTIKDLQDVNEETCIPASSGGKDSVQVFYRWVQDNRVKIQNMSYAEILREMGAAGIAYRTYCAMD